jgi:hypothetical protein
MFVICSPYMNLQDKATASGDGCWFGWRWDRHEGMVQKGLAGLETGKTGVKLQLVIPAGDCASSVPFSQQNPRQNCTIRAATRRAILLIYQ